MENENGRASDTSEGKNGESSGENAPRARNRTVMLTPEMTGQVRARLAIDTPGVAPAEGGKPENARSESARPEPARSEPARPETAWTEGARAESPRTEVPRSESRPGAAQQASYQPPPAPPHAAAAEEAVHVEPAARPASPQRPQPRPEAAPRGESAMWVKPTPVVGFMVSFDNDHNGDIYELRSGRLIVTSELNGVTGNVLHLEDPSVSPMHAVMRITGSGEVQLLDQLSEHGTTLLRMGSDSPMELSGEKATVEHGDVIKFGERKFYVALLALHDK